MCKWTIVQMYPSYTEMISKILELLCSKIKYTSSVFSGFRSYNKHHLLFNLNNLKKNYVYVYIF